MNVIPIVGEQAAETDIPQSEKTDFQDAFPFSYLASVLDT
jgi:hypothetical protein